MSLHRDRPTSTYMLADTLLPQGLKAFVLDRRQAGQSWRRIALELRDATDRKVDVTHQTLCTWFADEDAA